MTNYRLTKKATENLAHIWNYTIDTWSENQADHYFNMLLEYCQDISDGRVYGKNMRAFMKDCQGKKPASI